MLRPRAGPARYIPCKSTIPAGGADVNRSCLFAARITFLAACLVGLALLSADTSGQEPKVKPAVDPELAYHPADTDKDGELSKEEFAKLMANNPRVKDNP